jgi:hypothetical protein
MNHSGRADGRTGGRWAAALSASPAVRLSAMVLLAACQPQSRRLLLLDLQLSDPIALDGTAEPWHAAGYTVEYRRFFPHLTRADLERYNVLLLLAGGEPEHSSDALSAGDLVLLGEWVGRGGVVVVGYAADGEGSADRWVMNRWLAAQGAGMVIGDYVLADTTRRQTAALEPQPYAIPVKGSGLRAPGFTPFPFGRNHQLLVARAEQALARATAAAFVRRPGQRPEPQPGAVVAAASRVGPGLVVVASRHALGALGVERQTADRPLLDPEGLAAARTFLVTLARWTRRPAEWAHIPPARAGRRLVLLDSPRAVAPRPPRLAPPPGVSSEPLPAPTERSRRPNPPDVSPWAPHQTLRAVWAPLAILRPATPAAVRRAALDSLIGFLDVGGFNTMGGDVQAWAADSIHAAPWERDVIRIAWKQAVDRLGATSFDWIPEVVLREFRIPLDTAARGVRGDSLAAWCALDARLWDQALAPAMRQVARLAAGAPDVIPAVAIDLDAAGVGTDLDAFCDPDWRAGLEAMPAGGALPPERRDRFLALSPEQRYDSLLEAGLLGAYFDALERAVARRAEALRLQVRRLDPDLGIVLRSSRFPEDWWAVGLAAGLAAPGAPVVLFTPTAAVPGPLARLAARGAPAVHAIELSPERLPAAAWAKLGRIVATGHAGFWIRAGDAGPGRIHTAEGWLPADSLARLIRRTTKLPPP